MQNRYILTPFFLDGAREGLNPVAGADWTVNMPSLPQGDMQTRLAAIHEPLAQFVAKTLEEGARPVSVAGDCCATIGVMAGLERAGVEPVLVWLDAHGEFNTWESTPSGFLGGMPLAMIVGRGELTMPHAVGLTPFPEARVVLCDARDLDAGERTALENSQVHHIPDLQALLESDVLNAPLYVHFDTDLVNPKDAPAQSYATAGGPTFMEMREFFRALAQSKNIIAVSMSAWNPDMDKDGKTQAVSMELFRTLLGDKWV
jgi:arginase